MNGARGYIPEEEAQLHQESEQLEQVLKSSRGDGDDNAADTNELENEQFIYLDLDAATSFSKGVCHQSEETVGESCSENHFR